jgi:hypothetical protein
VVSPSRSRLRHHTWYTALILASILLLLFPQTPAARLALDDDTPPVVGYTVDGTTGTNGWYRGSPGRNYIVVHWTVTDPQSPIISTTGCEPAIQVNGPSTGTTLTCSATSDGGTTAVTTKSLKIDATPPDTTAAPSRAPNGAGWYRTPVSISWSGTDATSGIASCRTPLTYGGPDTIGTAQSGSCTDNAGNSSSDAVVVRYDSTPPATTAASLPAPNANGWLKSPVSVTWSGSDATSGIAACDPSIAYSGPDTSGTD